MTMEEALCALRAASPHRDIQAEDARTLIQPVAALAAQEPRQVVDSVGESLLAHEMESLFWQPLGAVQLILILIERGCPSQNLMELALNYLSMYFQELDEEVEACRSKLRSGMAPSEVSVALAHALCEVEGARSGDNSQ